MKKAAIAVLATAALGFTALPASAEASAGPVGRTANACAYADPAGQEPVPQLNQPNAAALAASISSAPDNDTTGALVRVTGSAGDWSGTAGSPIVSPTRR